MPDYKTNDPKGWHGDPSRGAALGRHDVHDASPEFDGVLTLKRILIVDGYDPNGTYYGDESPLYWYADDEGDIDAVTRAKDREDAKKIILKRYPKAKFAEETVTDEFVDAYLTCALWSSNDESDEDGGEPLNENYNVEDFAPKTRAQMEQDCAAFWSDNLDDLKQVQGICDSSRAGHNFWFNRNRHGSGFWDEYYGDDAELRAAFDRLSKASKAYGTFSLYVVGDDGSRPSCGKIHGS